MAVFPGLLMLAYYMGWLLCHTYTLGRQLAEKSPVGEGGIVVFRILWVALRQQY
jgi:hypothetical protein